MLLCESGCNQQIPDFILLFFMTLESMSVKTLNYPLT